jgi:hypothetical protein
MKKLIILLFAALLLMSCSQSVNRAVSVLLVYSTEDVENFDAVKKGYESVLEEEGVPYRWGHYITLLQSNPQDILKNTPAIIFPDKISQFLHSDISGWVREYISYGGNVLVAFDSGTKDKELNFTDNAIFAENTGFNYVLYNELEDGAETYKKANIYFKDRETSDFFEIPYGKVFKNKLVSYGYPNLQYTVSSVSIKKPIPKNEIIAESVFDDGSRSPNTILKKVGDGNFLFVNIPLGYLKVFGTDDMLLRSFLRTFLFKIAKIPHISSAPFNKGGLIINWHVDNNIEIKNIPQMIREGILRKDMQHSFSVTAGDYVLNPDDGKGFDAGGRGRKILKKLMDFGSLGSHGGWAHNWFAKSMKDSLLSYEEIKNYVIKNNAAIEKTTKYKITEYAAPEGVHPQPYFTEILEELGFKSYYYPGDAGSCPNRTFFKGEMVSEKVIAFPIMPFWQNACIVEMSVSKITSRELEEWIFSVLDYVCKNKNTRLIYSHLYDFLFQKQYKKPFNKFLDEVENRLNDDELIVAPMSYFTDFMLKHLQTEYEFENTNFGMRIEISNSKDLEGITLAIPKKEYMIPVHAEFKIIEEDDYYKLICKGKIHEAVIDLDYR